MNLPTALVASAVAALLAVGPSAARAEAGKKKEQIVEIAVTSEGFVPTRVKVKKGQPVKLVVTRKTEKTCATELVMKEFGVDQPLPLDKTVAVTVTPQKPGSYRFACAMDMIAGTLDVE